MRVIQSMPVDYNTAVKYRGQHREVHYEITAHKFKKEEDVGFYDFPVAWATYVLMNEEQHEKFKPHLEDAPWNCGQTYYRKETQEHIGVSPEMAAKWNKPMYKMGDDFMHLYDHECIDLYSREYMERHIKEVIDYLVDTTAQRAREDK